jgi:hypothetical protein
MSLDMPQAVTAYFDAEKTSDANALDTCFAQDATVRDEGLTHRGLDAIKKWKTASRIKYQYTVDLLSASQDGQHCTVRARIAGNFAGSPVVLAYAFAMQEGKIALLEIGIDK